MSGAFKPVVGLLAAVVVVAGIGVWSKLAEKKEIIPWRSDFLAARQEAQTKQRPVLLYFSATWCGPCQNLRHTTWADPKVDQALRNVVPVKLDFDQQPELAREYHVEALPTFKLLANDGTPIKSHEGAMQSDEFLSWLGNPGG
jgi:thioredoxin-like negative regulator of GroEL